jgi:hypothetical protein
MSDEIKQMVSDKQMIDDYFESWQNACRVIGERDKTIEQLKAALEDALGEQTAIKGELNFAGYEFVWEGEEPVIECIHCRLPICEGHADDCLQLQDGEG